MERGYVKLWRKSIDSAILQNPNLWVFWTWCLMKATHKPVKQMVGFQEVELQPGQFIFGRKQAAKEMPLSEQNIRTCLKVLKKSKNLTIKPTSKFSIITIINWDTYQPDTKTPNHQSNQQVTSSQPASNQQVTTNKNIKNIKNIKNKKESKEKKFNPPTLEEVIQFFESKNFPPELAQKAFDYYSVADWKDGKGTQVKNWKQKMIAVWMKDEEKQPRQAVSKSKAQGEMDQTVYALNRFLNRERG